MGLTKLGDTSFGGAGIAELLLPEAQRITDHEGQFDQISVAAKDGVSAEELRDRIARVMPRQVQVETGEQAAQRQTDDIADNLKFLRIALLVFAGVSLFVGAFQIFNTFSITVAQRTREFGMLARSARRARSCSRQVVLEALVLGLLGAAFGLAGGVAFAFGINELFKAVGIDLPNTGTVVTLRTVIVSLIVGVVVTLVAALVPALKATRVTPMAALRDAELQDSKPRGRAVLILALVVGLAGLAMMLIGLFGGIPDSGSAAGLLGGGAALMLFGVSLFSPRLVRPLASLTGRPLERLRGLTGRLARENAMRKPARTATTAGTPTIGLAPGGVCCHLRGGCCKRRWRRRSTRASAARSCSRTATGSLRSRARPEVRGRPDAAACVVDHLRRRGRGRRRRARPRPTRDPGPSRSERLIRPC